MSLVATVNAALDEIAARRDAGAGGAAAEREMAERYQRLSDELDQLTLGSPTLDKAVDEYRELLRDVTRQLRRSAAARERDDAATVAVVERELAGVLRREKLLVQRIDSICQSP